jgi:hypothetical protein
MRRRYLKELNSNTGDSIILPFLRKLELLGDQTCLAADVAEVGKFISQRKESLKSPFDITQRVLGKLSENVDLKVLRLRSCVKKLPQRSVTPDELVQIGSNVPDVSNLRHLFIRNDPSVHLRINKMVDYPILSIDSVILATKFARLRTLQLSRVVAAELDLAPLNCLHSLKMDHCMFEKLNLPISISNIDFETLRSKSVSAIVSALWIWLEENPHCNLNSIQISACVTPWRVLKALCDTVQGRVRNLGFANLALPDSEVSDPFSSASSFTDSESLEKDDIVKEAMSPIAISLERLHSLVISTDRDFPRFQLSNPDGSLKYLNVPSDLIDGALSAAWPQQSRLSTFHLSQKRFHDHETDVDAVKQIISKSKTVVSVSLPPLLHWSEPASLLQPLASNLRRLQLSGPAVTDVFLHRVFLILPNLVEIVLGTCRSVSSLSWLAHKNLSECRIRGLECAEMRDIKISGADLPEIRTLEISFRSAKKISIAESSTLTKLSLHGAVSRTVSISGCNRLSEVALLVSSAAKVTLDAPNVTSLHIKVPTKSAGGSVAIKSKFDKLMSLSLDVSNPADTKTVKLLEQVAAAGSKSRLMFVSLSASLDDDTDDEEAESYEHTRDRDVWRNWTQRALAALSGKASSVWNSFSNLQRVETPFKTLNRVL